MVTPIDLVCLQMASCARGRDETHYHIADPQRARPRALTEAANFHIVDRTISLAQIGFDYYDNIVTYRV